MKQVIAGFVLGMVLSTPSIGQQEGRTSGEQRSFNLGGLEDRIVRHPVTLSDADLAALAKDQLMKRELDQDPPIALSGKGLEAGVVHLNGPKERDLIVVGNGAPFMGANIGPFWVIRELANGPKVVLSVLALSVRIRSTRHRGLRDINCSAVIAAGGWFENVYGFDGLRYNRLRSEEGQAE